MSRRRGTAVGDQQQGSGQRRGTSSRRVGQRCMVYGVCCVAHGLLRMVRGVCCMTFDVWRMVCGVVCDVWRMLYGA